MQKPLALVIDDEPDIRELLTLTLGRMDIDTIVAEDVSGAKQELARTLGVVAQLELRGNILAVTLEGDTSPSALKLLLSHPVDAKLDQELLLAQVSTGNYETRWQAGNHPRWHWHLEPLGVSEQEHWRIDGEISGLSADGH